VDSGASQHILAEEAAAKNTRALDAVVTLMDGRAHVAAFLCRRFSRHRAFLLKAAHAPQVDVGAGNPQSQRTI
jgi:hypothetical protein